MDERLVQWTLMRNLSELSTITGKPIIKKIAEEYTTDQGRIDFILVSCLINTLAKSFDFCQD